MKEEWKDIPLFENYEISNKGIVRNKTTKHILKPQKKGNNESVNLYKEGKYRGKSVDLLVRDIFGIDINITKTFEDLEGEIWKEIDGAKKYYISNFGRAKSRNFTNNRTENLLKLTPDAKGNLRFFTSKKDKLKNIHVHRAMAVAFIPNPTPKNRNMVIHVNGNKLDNRLENLRWVNNSENIKNAFDNGAIKKKFSNENHNFATVEQYTPDGIHHIKTWDAIADATRAFGIPTTNISKVCKGKRKTAGGYFWRYVEENQKL